MNQPHTESTRARTTPPDSAQSREDRQILEASPVALVREARRLSEDLCRHWEDTGAKPCVPELTDCVSRSLVGDLWTLATAVEEGWKRATAKKDHRDASRNHAVAIAVPTGLLRYAQSLVTHLHEALDEHLDDLDPLPGDATAAFHGDVESVERSDPK